MGARMLFICTPALCRVLGLSAVEHTALSLVQFVKHCIDHVHIVSICVISNKIMKYSGHLYQVRNTELEALVLSWANLACSFLLPHVKIVIF